VSDERRAHPALGQDSNVLVCANGRCATVLAADTQICDECGGTRLDALANLRAMLCGWAGERAVVFKLIPGLAALIGRSTGMGPIPDVDLGRMPGSGHVHRRQAWIEGTGPVWRVTQLGTNPLVVLGHTHVDVPTGHAAEIRHGDTLDVAGIRLTLVLRAAM